VIEMRYEEAMEWLYGTQMFGIKLGLENTGRMLGEWALPKEGQRIFHVAGTNGKGSVCAMVDSICREGGYRTGLFTSPHLVTYRERVRVDFEMIGEGDVVRLLSELREMVSGWETHPTFFELTTVLALRYFAERECEVVVMETGMGGRLDATTGVMEAMGVGGYGGRGLSVITRVGIDHEKWLGDTLAKVAWEKAGIMKAGVPVVSAVQAGEVEAVLREEAGRVGTTIEFVPGEYEGGALGLDGAHQRRNAALARAAVLVSGMRMGEEAMAAGLAGVRWPGRFERIGERLVLDGAHNPQAMRSLVETWRATFGEEKGTVIFGTVELKDVRGMVGALAGIAARFIVVTVGTGRGVPAAELGELVREVTLEPCTVVAELEEALEVAGEVAGEGRVLVTGSLFLVGECLGVLGGDEFEGSLQ
jgi:dihydrofolate synthase/folylpolyglutamate synthase